MQKPKGKKRGRGQGRPAGHQKHLVALRIENALMDRIRKQAEANTITPTEEIVRRVQQSFFFDVPEPERMILIEAFAALGRAADGHKHWCHEVTPDVFHRAVVAFILPLIKAAPDKASVHNVFNSASNLYEATSREMVGKPAATIKGSDDEE